MNKIGEKNTGTRGKGRPKGSPNKVTKELKEMILGALDESGGQSYLVTQARDNPNAFLSLIGKVLPTTLANPEGGNAFEGITVQIVDANSTNPEEV